MIPRLFLTAVFLGVAGLVGTAAPIKVACIGDSITEGAGLSNPALESYPAKLHRLLGPAYEARNYGVSGRTLLKKGDFPYWNENAYRQSREWNPDIVVIQLGTNDSKPQNWRHSTNFLSDYESLIASYTNLASHPRVVLCTPCPVYANGAFDIRPGVVRTNIAPAVRDLAAGLGHEVIDLQTALVGHSEWFPDTVHPNSRGATVMATVVRTAIVGRNASGVPPRLDLSRVPLNRAALSWPSASAGFVLQSATLLRETNTAWTVVEQLAVNDGAVVRVTNSVAGSLRIYRLWQP